MRILTHQLIGNSLDYAIAKVLKLESRIRITKDGLFYRDTDDNLTPWHPSGNLGHAIRIACARKVAIVPCGEEWACRYKSYVARHRDPAVAMMRVICMADLPLEVSVPSGLEDVDQAATRELA